jgi:hypothetical protein
VFSLKAVSVPKNRSMLGLALRSLRPGLSKAEVAVRQLNRSIAAAGLNPRGIGGMRAAATNSGATAEAGRAAEVGAAAGAVAAEPKPQGKVHTYPDEPRVGVGVVILRALPPERQPEVLLIRRAKEPAKGWFEGFWDGQSVLNPALGPLC